MVKEKIVNEMKCHMCEECELAFEDHKKACECEEFCRKNKACSLELIKHSINARRAS